MKTHDVGRLFSVRLAIKPGTPLYHRAPTIEIEEPFRKATTHIFRYSKNYAIGFGWWQPGQWESDEDALIAAIQGESLGDFEEPELSEDVKDKVRTLVAEHAIDVDDEWQLISYLGVEK